MPSPSDMFCNDTPELLTEEQERAKRAIYERMNPRRRKFIDRLGYDNWDPFQKPNDPLDLRTDGTKRTASQLVDEFRRCSEKKAFVGNDYSKGVLECAFGVVNNDEKFWGVFDFCLWYHKILQREGKAE